MLGEARRGVTNPNKITKLAETECCPNVGQCDNKDYRDRRSANPDRPISDKIGGPRIWSFHKQGMENELGISRSSCSSQFETSHCLAPKLEVL